MAHAPFRQPCSTHRRLIGVLGRDRSHLVWLLRWTNFVPKDNSDELALDITLTLLRVINRIQSNSRAQNVEGRSGLTLIEAEICHIILDREGITASELAQILGVSRSAISQVISRMRTKDFIREDHDESNAKRKRLSLTGKGRSVATVLTDYAASMRDFLFNESHEELEAYLRFVTKLEAFHTEFRERSRSADA